MRTLVLVLALVGSSVVVPVASAQTDLERATAREAAGPGVAAYEAGDYERAVEALSQAERLVHALPHLLYLARAQAKLGKLVVARETYLKITRERLGEHAPSAFVDAQLAAQKERELLEARVPAVTVTIEGEAAKDVSVTMDGTTLPVALIGLRMPVDPGEHAFKATAASGQSEPITILLAEGERKTVVLKLTTTPISARRAPTRGPSVTRQPPAVDTRPETSSGLQTASYAAFGAGAVGLGVGAYFLAASASTSSGADDLYDDCGATSPGGTCSNPEVQQQVLERDEDAARQRTFGVAGLVAGAVAAGAGVALLVIDAKHDRAAESAHGWRLQVRSGLGSVGLSGNF